jgi:hypothetical protein
MTDRKDWLEPLRERARKLEEETKQIRARTVKLRNRIAARLKDVEAPNGDWLRNYPEVTRVEVITNNGREFVQYECSNVQVSLQDDGQTIKVFLFLPTDGND